MVRATAEGKAAVILPGLPLPQHTGMSHPPGNVRGNRTIDNGRDPAMTIHDDVLHARIPRLGSITTGHGVEATSSKGMTYSKPTKASTLVFHCNDADVAAAVQGTFGGTISTDSLNWACDVITDVRDAPVGILPAGFRQALESWRAAQCLRRCDGVTMTTVNGRPVSQPCLCDAEMARGQDRTCTPSTVLPCFVDLTVERFGVWEIRSTAWGTASSLKGVMRALAMVGAGQATVPAVLSMVARTVRDTHDKVHQVEELQVAIAQSRQALEGLSGKAAALDSSTTGALPAGVDQERLDLLTQWAGLATQISAKGLRDALLADWRAQFGQRDIEGLSTEELSDWVDHVTDRLWDAAGSDERPPEPPEGGGEGTPSEQAATSGSAQQG